MVCVCGGIKLSLIRVGSDLRGRISSRAFSFFRSVWENPALPELGLAWGLGFCVTWLLIKISQAGGTRQELTRNTGIGV
jgi:hypothetical protein